MKALIIVEIPMVLLVDILAIEILAFIPMIMDTQVDTLETIV